MSVICSFTLEDLRNFVYFNGPVDTNYTTFVIKGKTFVVNGVTMTASFEAMFLRKIVRGLGYEIIREAIYFRDGGDETEITTTVPWNVLVDQ
jgi:hypothetical protein